MRLKKARRPEGQKARTACRRNFLLNFLQRIPTNLNLDNLPFQSERAVGVLAALRHNQTVQNVILAADTAHRIRNEVTHQPLNDAILEDYTELCQNNVFLRICQTEGLNVE